MLSGSGISTPAYPSRKYSCPQRNFRFAHRCGFGIYTRCLGPIRTVPDARCQLALASPARRVELASKQQLKAGGRTTASILSRRCTKPGAFVQQGMG